MSINSIYKSKDQILDTLKNIQKDIEHKQTSKNNQSTSNESFFEHLSKATHDINKQQTIADAKSVELNTGRNGNIHETMLAATQAELSFNLLVQIRNKALEAYNEIMRMPV